MVRPLSHLSLVFTDTEVVAGTYTPIVDKEYAFSEVLQAYERQMSGRYVPYSIPSLPTN
jgi:hypothetical protein